MLLSIKLEYVSMIIQGKKQYKYRKFRCHKNVNKIIIYATAPQKHHSKVGAYGANQKHTWRVYEKVSTLNMDWYTSTILNTNNYTFGSSTKKELIVNSANFYSNYSSSLKALTTSYSSQPKINGTGYLSVSTWYTPTTVTNFSVNYSYETNNNTKITPTYILVGDVNQDRFVNNDDCELVSKYIANQTPNKLSDEQLLAADVNNDNVVDFLDLVVISKFTTANIENF